MNKKLTKLSLALGTLAVAAVSCQDYDLGFDAKGLAYKEQFEQRFGKIDPNQDWSMATLVEAKINLPEIKGTAKMNIMTGDPRNSSTRLLAQLMLQDGQGEIQFNAIKGRNDVFVTVEQDGKYKLFTSYPIVNGALTIGVNNDLTRAGYQVPDFAETCPTTKDGDLLEINVSFEPLAKGSGGGGDPLPMVLYITYNNNEKTLDEWKVVAQSEWERSIEENWSYEYANIPFDPYSIAPLVDPEAQYPTFDKSGSLNFDDYRLKSTATSQEKPAGGSGSSAPTTKKVKIQYLNNVENVAAKPWAFGWGYNLFGTNAIFQERIRYFLPYKHNANGGSDPNGYQKYGLLYDRDALDKLEEGFAITTTGGTIEMPYIYGATQTKNQFGYVYWQDGEDPLTKPHYILMDDATPDNNIYWDEWGVSTKHVGDMDLSNFHSYESYLANKNNGIRYCACQVGNGKWSAAHGEHDLAQHAYYCQTTDPSVLLDNPTCTCLCNKRGTGIYSSETATHTAECIDYFDDYLAAYNKLVYGSKYRLMYFGDNGENTTGSYVFPSEKTFHIAFFISPRTKELGHDNTGHRLGANYNYSLPELNRRIGNLYWNTESPSFVSGNNVPGDEHERGNVKAISWTQTIMNLDGTEETVTLLGFGDNSGDNDLNDIIFMVKGNYTPSTPQFEAAPIKWHMNYNPLVHTDTDLYFEENKSVGKTYSQPATFPTRDGYTFLGWAESANGTPIADSNTTQAIVDQPAPSGGKCYYAIWEPVASLDPDPEPVPDPEWISWIFACEDLGGTFDYDFNDVVLEFTFGVTYMDNTHMNVGIHGGTGNGSSARREFAELYLVAAGGTLPAEVYYGDQLLKVNEKSEIHQIFGQDASQVYNIVNATNPMTNGPICIKKFTDDEAAQLFWNGDDPRIKNDVLSIVTDNIKIKVTGNDGNSHFVTVPSVNAPYQGSDKAPEIIVLPYDWEWPTENTFINDAYPGFKNWANDATWADWQTGYNQSLTVKHNY